MNALEKQGYSIYDLQKDLAYEGMEQDLAEIQAVFTWPQGCVPTESLPSLFTRNHLRQR